MPAIDTWEIFCRVIDNYGDIGVCWRLARQLAAEHRLAVRLWADDLDSLHRICAAIDPALDAQVERGVEVRRWAQPWRDTAPAAVVIEAFGCHIPERHIAAMAARTPAPLWLNLEYLSAEHWIAGCHGLASPHPALPLTKYFFFPGFGAGSGGVLREAGLGERRQAFGADTAAQALFWKSIGIGTAAPDELRVSLFCYPGAALAPLLDEWAGAEHPVVCIVPRVGPLIDALRAALGVCALEPGTPYRHGSLCLQPIPFLEQDRYDQLLWACDCNFVRGEDSFVRAQWAARPFVWHIYPQPDGAHWPKLRAFLERYCVGLAEAPAAAVRGLWEAWNQGCDIAAAWRDWQPHRAALARHDEAWARRLAAEADLASNLLEFARSKTKA